MIEVMNEELWTSLSIEELEAGVSPECFINCPCFAGADCNINANT